MQKYILLLTFIATATCHESRRHRVEDPFAMIDKHLTHTLAYHYMWPWSQLVRAAAALEIEESMEEPQVVSDQEKLQVNLNMKRFKPDELRIKVKNRHIVLEGKKKNRHDPAMQFMSNHFIQRIMMPPGSLQEEVTAVYKENGVLSISVPKHEVPPPPPDRDVPIEVIVPTRVPEKTEKPETEEKIENSTVKKVSPALPIQTSSATPLEQLDLVEATTHVGKIRKKELKTTTKTTQDNEVTKGFDNNGLDYALVGSQETI